MVVIGAVVVESWTSRLTSLQFRLGLAANKPNYLGMLQPKRFISGKTMRGPLSLPEKPAPFPYKTKKYSFYHQHFDRTSARFDENTKIIIVDGNVGAGKTTLAKALAEEFEMLFIPEADMDLEYKNKYGYDLRDYKHLIPESVRPFDLADFYENPKHPLVSTFQMMMYKHRYLQYIDVLKHIFNTGQGVVMDRSVYSDFCFVETMFKHGYFSKEAKQYYYELRKNSIVGLMKPHLVIYLDVPADILLERIKKRGNDCEQNTSVLTTEYLQTLADVYKNEYLKDIGKHAELLIYDWSKFGDIDMVVEDIERMDFDKFTKYDTKMADWNFADEYEYTEHRNRYTNMQNILISYLFVPVFCAPELFGDGADLQVYHKVHKMVPGNRYEYGFNKDLGDTSTLFK